MTLSDRKKELLWIGRHVGTLLHRMTETVNTWVAEIESDTIHPSTEIPPEDVEGIRNAKPCAPHPNPSSNGSHSNRHDFNTDDYNHIGKATYDATNDVHIQDQTIEHTRLDMNGISDQQNQEQDHDHDYKKEKDGKDSGSTDNIAIRPWKKRHDKNSQNDANGKGNKYSNVSKRVRLDWTEQENLTLFDTLEKFPTLSEDMLLQEIVKALSGSRTLFQTKGRFRNLLASGRIRKTDSKPQKWTIIPGKASRRVRVNWTDEENEILFATIEKHSSLSEDDVLQEVVKALQGSRTWFQTKGRFRNLLASGKICASDKHPQRWLVRPNL